jgi:plasmid maintenance system antidote protein VapI
MKTTDDVGLEGQEFWMEMQTDYDLEEARERLGDQLDREVCPRTA